MRVKILTNLGLNDYPQDPGNKTPPYLEDQVREVDDVLGAKMVKRGHAVETEESLTPVPQLPHAALPSQPVKVKPPTP